MVCLSGSEGEVWGVGGGSAFWGLCVHPGRAYRSSMGLLALGGFPSWSVLTVLLYYSNAMSLYCKKKGSLGVSERRISVCCSVFCVFY